MPPGLRSIPAIWLIIAENDYSSTACVLGCFFLRPPSSPPPQNKPSTNGSVNTTEYALSTKAAPPPPLAPPLYSRGPLLMSKPTSRPPVFAPFTLLCISFEGTCVQSYALLLSNGPPTPLCIKVGYTAPPAAPAGYADEPKENSPVPGFCYRSAHIHKHRFTSLPCTCTCEHPRRCLQKSIPVNTRTNNFTTREGCISGICLRKPNQPLPRSRIHW